MKNFKYYITNAIMVIIQFITSILFLNIGTYFWGISISDLSLWNFILGLIFLYFCNIVIINFKFDWQKEL
jgi:asparagine N-glycosylation enzyme membrane subunit Stt3